MGELIKEINERRAKRAFSEKKIPDEVIRRVMTAATYAPSCQNNQSWRFLVAREEKSLKKIHDTLSGGNYWAHKAPVIVIVATQNEFACRLNDKRDYAFFDCGLAVENLLLQAVKEGMYSHPVAGFDPIKIKEIFNISMDYIIITLVAVGYPGDESYLNKKHLELEHSQRDSKPVSDVICYERWELDSISR